MIDAKKRIEYNGGYGGASMESRLPDRNSFMEECSRQDADLSRPVSIILADINGLRSVNERFGMDAGDHLLTETALILKNCCGEQEYIARIGGDEFGILLPDTDSKQAQEICRRIHIKCAQHVIPGAGRPSLPDLSLGCKTRTGLHDSLAQTFGEAERRMYRHKLLEPQSAYSSIVTSILSIMRVKYDSTIEHDTREMNLCCGIGAAIGITDTMQDELELTSLLRDIGKIAVSDAIINKHAKLSKEEKREIQKHPEIGCRIAQSIVEFSHISDYIQSHHEKWDGTGYPNKLAGEDIPLVSRIISIVDAYDAMTMNRPYREALPEEYAINEIRTCAGSQFDPVIARVFVEKVLKKKW